ncbi:MAG: tetratricopeptide repeat protein [Gammaproteobacteria bacterium]|nr:tetratricopeptide repeat protein [Gammaproteobacteria bacterium]MDH5617434.1 tetratricopeptide repeat protein [Gammaproteobacteria bacterium]
MKNPLSFISRFSTELLRRKVYPVIVAYAVIAWVLLQIGEVTFEPLGLPEWAMRALVVVAIIGFPVAALFAWMFDIAPSGIRREIPAEVAAKDDAVPSVAVLPFADMSPDHDQAYFCEGVAEEILNALTQIEALHVVSRTSSFRYAQSSEDLQSIGRKLAASAILEGSVRKDGDNLRITAQLVNVADGFHLWSKTFDRKLEDVFAIQDEIATCIGESLLDTLMPVTTTACCDVVAYDFYLRGRHFLNRFRKVDLEHARQLFGQSIERDPDFAAAWAGYADSYSLAVMYADTKPAFRDMARQASERALELDPNSAEAHASAGLAHLVREDFEDAERELRRSIELNPAHYEAYYYFARTRFHQGDMDAAADLFAKAAEVNPDDYQSRLLRVQILRGEGKLEQAKKEARAAVEVVERQLEWHPDDIRALHLGAGSLILLGQTARAERWLQRALQVDPHDPIVLYNVACNYATMNKLEQALDFLEQAVLNGAASLDWMMHDKDLVSLHGHPRYEALLAKAAR